MDFILFLSYISLVNSHLLLHAQQQWCYPLLSSGVAPPAALKVVTDFAESQRFVHRERCLKAIWSSSHSLVLEDRFPGGFVDQLPKEMEFGFPVVLQEGMMKH